MPAGFVRWCQKKKKVRKRLENSVPVLTSTTSNVDVAVAVAVDSCQGEELGL